MHNKYFLLAAFCAIFAAGNAQKPDTSHAVELNLTGSLLLDTTYFLGTVYKTSDTIPVIILCCDTTFLNYGDNTFTLFHGHKDGKDQEIGIFKNRVPYVYWDFAYLVRKHFGWKYSIYFIDKNKKPLSKSIIIWQYKNLNE